MASEPSQTSDSANTTPLATPSPIPPPVPVETHPNRGQFRPLSRSATDPTRLAPEDVFKHTSPPKLRPLHEINGLSESSASAASLAAAALLRPAVASLRAPPAIPPVAARLEQERKQRKLASRSSRHRRGEPRQWKKLLWIKQEFPDNYTDNETFLDHLQRNPRLRPYDFWPLVENSIVIVQHVCSVVIFVSAYAGIYQDRLSPVAVVTCGSIATLIGWKLWDTWMGEEEAKNQAALERALAEAEASMVVVDGRLSETRANVTSATKSMGDLTMNGGDGNSNSKKGLGLSLSTSNLSIKNGESKSNPRHHNQSLSRSSFQSISPIEPLTDSLPGIGQYMSSQSPLNPLQQQQNDLTFKRSPAVSYRKHVRLKTFKSSLLIYFALLGISPILKSLTKSTSSDSIWALATWLLIINIFFFDYSSVPYSEEKISTHSPTTIHPPTTTAAASVATQPSGISTSKINKQPVSSITNTTTSITLPPPPTTTSSAHRSSSSLLKPSSTSSSRLPNLAQQKARLRSMSVSTPAGATTGGIPKIYTSSQPPFPSSLSTNAALMASTVLASRLPTTTSVFSLSLFSIQVFGLFPVFRRHLKHRSPLFLHILLTINLIAYASAGLFLILSKSYTHTYGYCGWCWSWIWHVLLRATLGVIVGWSVVFTCVVGTSWWLINLQRYKNVVTGPWDPAKPVLTGGGVGLGGTVGRP